jgi:hypothetical protein
LKEDLGVEGENEESGRNVTVVLSGKDLIVDTKAVRRYLTTSFSEELGAKNITVCMPNGNGKPNKTGNARITKIRNEDTGA